METARSLDNLETLGDRIRHERDIRGWTQADLAERMAASSSEVPSLVRAIRRWEHGEVEPKRSAVRRVAAAFDVPIGWLDVEDDDPTMDLTEDLHRELAKARSEVRRAVRALDFALREAAELKAQLEMMLGRSAE